MRPGGETVPPGIGDLLAALFAAQTARADGCILPPLDGDVSEGSQEAFIAYDPDTRTEDLVLRVGFQGDRRDFAWIVPVPSLPVLEEADVFFFTQCRLLTRPIYRQRDEGLGCRSTRPGNDVAPAGVEIYDEQRVGIYQTLTLGASEADALADSLERWGYLHDRNRRETRAALQTYIDRAWYFVAMRVDSTSLPFRPPGYIWYGYLQPIRLTFASDEIVYPMRISAISSREEVGLTMYVCAPHRMEFPGAALEYANCFSPAELAEARDDCPLPAAFLDEGRFLTRLHAVFRPSTMGEDLVLRPAASDEEFRQLHYSGWPDHGMLPAGLLAAALFLAGWRPRLPGRRHPPRARTPFLD